MQILRIGIWPTLGRPIWACFPPVMAVDIGRNPTCPLRLDDPAVSGLHARVSLLEGRLELIDLGSRNGTMLDGERIDQSIPATGQAARVGGYTLRLYPTEVAQAPPEEMAAMFAHLRGQADSAALGQVAKAWADACLREPRAQAELARALLAEGKHEQALAAAERALWLSPDLPGGLLARALALERRGGLEEAAALLDRVASMDQADAEIVRARARVGRKREVYQKVRDLLGGAEAQPPAAPDQEAVLQAGPFIFHFSRGEHADLVLSAYAALARVGEALHQSLGFRADNVRVRILTHASHGRESVAAEYDGEVRVYAESFTEVDPAFLYVALAHEYVHLAVDRLAEGRCPAWLDEGLAQLVTQSPTSRDVAILGQAKAAGALLPLPILETDFVKLGDPRLVDLAYAQAYSLVECLQSEIGWDGLRTVLCCLGREQDLGQALAETGWRHGELEAYWLGWLS